MLGRKGKPHAAAPLKRDDASELREERSQRGLGAGGLSVRPEGLHELVALGRTPAMRGEVDEQEPALPAR
jgi:hypothetical protein